MKNKKTIREWLIEGLTAEEFEYVESIDKSERADFDKDTAYSLSGALMSAFVFSDTIQGIDYWIEVGKREPITNRKSRISNLKL